MSAAQRARRERPSDHRTACEYQIASSDCCPAKARDKHCRTDISTPV